MVARERLKAFRESLELSQEAMAELLDCDQTYVGLVERGLRNPGPKFTHRLETLSQSYNGGPIRTEDWLDDDALDVPQVKPAREARR